MNPLGVIEPCEWREARRRDRPVLESFTCTSPKPQRPRPHSKPWELVVQSGIRSLTPPAGPSKAYRLELCTAGLRAVALLAVVRGTAIGVVVKLMAIAIDVNSRGLGGAVADAAMEEVLRTAEELARQQGALRTVIAAWVHPQNEPSKALLSRFDFAFQRMATPVNEEWVVELRS